MGEARGAHPGTDNTPTVPQNSRANWPDSSSGESRRGKGGGIEISTKHKGHWDFTTGSPFISILLRICFSVSAPN